MEKLLVFRLSGEGSNGAEGKAEVVQLLAKLLADSIFSTNTVSIIMVRPLINRQSSCHRLPWYFYFKGDRSKIFTFAKYFIPCL